MRNDFRIPDLTFPSLRYGARETPWDLKVLLYKGGAKARREKVFGAIADGTLGDPMPERLELVTKIHEAINNRIAGGGRPATANSNVTTIRQLFAWADETKYLLTLDTAQTVYLHWTDALVHRQRVVRDINEASAYRQGAEVGVLLDLALGRQKPLVEMTRLSRPSRRKIARGVQAEKQILQATFSFGHLLQDICDGLPVDVLLKGPLPIHIPLRHGVELVEWSGYSRPKMGEAQKIRKPETPQTRQMAKRSVERRIAWEADGTLRTRYPLANLRIDAELLMFIAQTGMNLSQAHQLTLRNFLFASHLDGYQVKERKYRKGGEVLFEVFKDYKLHFERYLTWRRQLFPDSVLLFPFVRRCGRTEDSSPHFSHLRDTCKKVGLRFVSPLALRNTRVNWLLRRSGDPDLTAEMAQHTKETLIGVYERPSLQRAMGEVMRFWSNADPALARTIPAAPGECDGQPVPLMNMPKDAPQPDCTQASGCLWCEHHRDIDSQDFVWSLSCFRHLKAIEVSKWHPPQSARETHPAENVIARLTDKLRWFQDSNKQRRGWVEEALARVAEGNYHPDWLRLIYDVEYMA